MRGLWDIALRRVLLGLLLLGLGGSALAKPVAGRRLAVGLVVGEPTAVTGYFSLAQSFAIDAALGVVSPGQGDLAGHADVLVVGGGDARSSFTAAVYFGAGAFFIRYYGNLFAGARFPVGLALYLPQARLSLYGEAAVELLLASPYATPRDREYQTAVGLRFFF